MPRVVSFAAGTAAVFDQFPATGPTARQVIVMPYATRAWAILVGGSRLPMGCVVGSRTSSSVDSPVPPANVGRAGELPTGKEGAGRQPFLRKGTPGSASNSWIARLVTAKSLIIERTCLTSWGVFSTSRHVLSTSRAFGHSPSLYTSLSLKLLKKKEKAEKKGARRNENEHPRVGAFFPRVGASAYFLIHEFYPLPLVDSWKLVENMSFKFNDLIGNTDQSTNPRVALRVVTPFEMKAGGQLI